MSHDALNELISAGQVLRDRSNALADSTLDLASARADMVREAIWRWDHALRACVSEGSGAETLETT